MTSSAYDLQIHSCSCGDMGRVNVPLVRYASVFPSQFFSASYPLGIAQQMHGLRDKITIEKIEFHNGSNLTGHTR